MKVGKKRSRADAKSAESSVIQVKPYTIPNRGPYPYNVPKKWAPHTLHTHHQRSTFRSKPPTHRNTVPFTPTQVEAIRSGMQPGLTMVVGPPGTGKTDVAVQIISNLYHNFPDQRTLLVTHSNQALNQVIDYIPVDSGACSRNFSIIDPISLIFWKLGKRLQIIHTWLGP